MRFYSAILLPVVFIPFALAPAAEIAAPGWETNTIGPGTKPVLDIGPDGDLHVLTIIEGNNDPVRYARSPTIDGPWSPQVISTGFYYAPGDILVDRSGTAHLAWHDHGLPGPRHYTVEDDGTTTRVLLDTGPENHDGWDNALALDPEGTLHMVTIYPEFYGGENSLQYATYDGQSWDYTLQIPGSGLSTFNVGTSLDVDSEGRPHALFIRSILRTDPGELVHATKNNGTWTFDTVRAGNVIPRFPSHRLDSEDSIHAAWLEIDPADSTRADVLYGVRTGPQWEVELLDTLEDVDMSALGAIRSVSVQLLPDGTPIIAYGDNTDIRIATSASGVWHVQTVLTETSGRYRGMVDLALRQDGRPIIVYWEEQRSGPNARIAAFQGPPPPTGWLAE